MLQSRRFSLCFLLVSCLMGTSAMAGSSSGLVQLASGVKIYTNYKAPARGRPTVVLLNGLTYSLGDWDKYVQALESLDSGIGILRFDMIGMGQTLLAGELPVNYKISHSDQVQTIKELMDHFRIKKAYVAGLSYGGAIGIAFGTAHPEMLVELILMAPFTEPLKSMDQLIRQQIAATRITFPLNPATDDELYDYFLRQFIYANYPSLEPSVVENPYKLEGIFRMVQGVRKFDTLKAARRLPAGSTHLVVADQDQYIKKEVHDRFWQAVPAASKLSRIDISQSEHKIPEAIPAFAAAWTFEILNHRKELSQGLFFQGNTRDFNAKSGNLEIALQKSGK